MQHSKIASMSHQVDKTILQKLSICSIPSFTVGRRKDLNDKSQLHLKLNCFFLTRNKIISLCNYSLESTLGRVYYCFHFRKYSRDIRNFRLNLDRYKCLEVHMYTYL